MTRTAPYMVALVAAMTLAILQVASADALLGGPSTSFVHPRKSLFRSWTGLEDSLVVLRGGATAVDKEKIEFESSDGELMEEEDDDEEEDEEEEEEEELDPKLAKSAQAKAATIKTKVAKEAVKAAVAATVAPKKKKSSSSLLKLLHVPYIIRACLNPFTFIAMTRGYWASLVNLDYLSQNDSSTDLRSALQEKAKKGSGGGTRKRKFKPGQAKTLSDLPQLST